MRDWAKYAENLGQLRELLKVTFYGLRKKNNCKYILNRNKAKDHNVPDFVLLVEFIIILVA